VWSTSNSTSSGVWIGERQCEGISVAKANWHLIRGRKRALTADQLAELRTRAATRESRTILAQEYGISRRTLYQALKPDYQV
jgi:DNA invertase Pin-like site-specific DNA recombinase